MATTAWTHRTNIAIKSVVALSILFVLFVIFVPTRFAMGLDAQERYLQSRKEVVKINLILADEYLVLAVYVKLRNGSLQHPKIETWQTHHTLAGVMRVEKPERLTRAVSRTKPFFYLPVSKEIDEYLILVRKPTVSKVEENGVVTEKTEWSEWFLFPLQAEELSSDRRLKVPLFSDLVKAAEEQKELLELLRTKHAEATAAAIKKMNTPIRSGDEVPWYAK